ncbi:hypothetical protein PLCT2_01401 [Planctomycetaceae bacterium]|nr:hypothetical protein PLCT2_01401 [Planctomycetaceae bacterium]
MDGKLDPSFNTGADLRKLLRDPRRFDVGRAHGFRRASSPTGLLTKALRVALLASFCAVVALLLLQAAQLDVESNWESAAWIWLGVWAGGSSALIFIIAKLRAMLTPSAKGAATRVPETMAQDVGTEDWFSEDIRFFVRTFFLSAVGGIAIAAGAVVLIVHFLPEDVAADRFMINAIVRGGGTALAMLFGNIIWRLAERRHARLMDWS